MSGGQRVSRSGPASASGGGIANSGIVIINGGVVVIAEHRLPPAFVDLSDHLAPLLEPDALPHHRSSLVGRKALLGRLSEVLAVGPERSQLVLVSGPGGRGKSRLVLEALDRVQRQTPSVPVLVFQERRSLDGSAVAELPHSPVVVLVEDAHRLADQLSPLLHHARHTAGTVVMMTVRGTSSAAVDAEISRARFTARDVVRVDVGPLTLPAARALVDDLVGDGPALPPDFAELLALEGRDCPLIPVLAVAMAREGTLSHGPFVLDQNFRERVLEAYAEEVVGEVPGGLDRSLVQNVLAAVSAVAPLPLGDQVLAGAIAGFVEVSAPRLIAVVQALIDAGVVVAPNAMVRVFPEVVADAVLETAVVFQGQDLGYAGRIWTALGATSASRRLAVNLAELSWRLVATGGPDVFAAVWGDLVARVDLDDVDGLDGVLADLAVLADLQPRRLFGLLRDVQSSLPRIVRPRGDSEVVEHPSGPRLLRAVENTLDRLTPLLARCATADRELLPFALDSLWELAGRDHRPPESSEDHPARVLRGKLASFESTDSVDAALVVVDRVETWLTVPDPQGNPRTPLYVLEGLVAKSGLRTGWIRDGVALSPFLVDPEKVGSLRERIRRVLVGQARGSGLRRAAEATGLLGAALDRPVQFTGMTVTANDVLGWETEDLATLATLTDVAANTTEPLVRRLVRRHVAWHARRAESQAVRTAALALATALDERAEDDLTEAVLGGFDYLLPSLRGVPIPAGGAPHADAAPHPGDGHQTREKARARLYEAVAASLWAEHDPPGLVALLDQRVRAVRSAIGPAAAGGAGLLLHHLGRLRLGQVPDLVSAIVDLPEGPLDDHLHLLLDTWARHDLDTFCPVAGDLLEGRTGVRRAVARAFRYGDWGRLDPRLADLHLDLLRRTEDSVQRGFLLAASGPLIQADPVGAAAVLRDVPRDGGAGLAAGLGAACDDEPDAWTATLDDRQALAVLDLTLTCGWDDTTVQLIVSGIARRHPRAVLDALTATAVTAGHAPDVDGLPAALAEHPDEVAAWLTEVLAEELRPPGTLAAVLLAAFGKNLTQGASHAVHKTVETLGAGPLQRLAAGMRRCDALTVTHPALTTTILERAEGLSGSDAEGNVRQALLDLSFPSAWFWNKPGEAPAAFVKRRHEVAALADDSRLPPATRVFYTDATRALDATIEAHTRQDRDDEE